ncbi:hypothetical protein [Rhodanobacter lindaniclasticus]
MSYACDPYRDANGCIVWPACPAVAYEPARIEQQAVLGWNAGANSITELGGDLHTVFTMPAVSGVVIGLRSGRTRQTTPDLIEHGLYFNALGGMNLVHVVERGLGATSIVVRNPADTFEIRRVGGRVTYWRNGALLHASTARSTGAKVVNACLYASGDAV